MRTFDTVAELLYSLGLNGRAAVAFRNRLINGSFSFNQRTAPSTPTVFKPGAFIRDRWRAGPDGCTAACTNSSNGDTTIHIGKGSIVQIIDSEIYLPEGGLYCLSWSGTAIGRVITSGQCVEFESGPVVRADLKVGVSAIVEFSLPFNSEPVSVGLVQLEPGSTPTVFERRDDEAERCQRYFRRLIEPPLRGVIQTEDLAGRCSMPLSPPMRFKPKVRSSGLLFVFDGSACTPASSIVSDYSANSYLDIDLRLSSPLNVGRPALLVSAGQGGFIDVDAELEMV